MALFTDGSSNHKDLSGGWAWVAIDNNDGMECASGFVKGTTNNRMEMQAWIEGLNYLYEKYGKCDILVYCDSKVVGKGYTGEYRRKTNQDLWSKLLSAAEQHYYVEWIWVRGHDGNIYNEMVDSLAVQARKKEAIIEPTRSQ